MNCLTEIHYIEEIIGDGLIGFLRDDPVRPSIPLPVRITNNKSAYVLFNDNDGCIDAVECIAIRRRALQSLASSSDLMQPPCKQPL